MHTPFASFQFGEDAHALERFAGLRSQRACAAVRPEQALTRKHYSEEVHWAARPSDFYDDAVRAELRAMYWAAPKPALDRGPCGFAVHVRRGDVSPDGPDPARYTPNRVYAAAVRDVARRRVGEANASSTVCAFSQGAPADFAELSALGVELRLDEELAATFHAMVTAENLLIATSSLSYAAAILSENRVYYTGRLLHRPLDDWHRIDCVDRSCALNSPGCETGTALFCLDTTGS